MIGKYEDTIAIAVLVIIDQKNSKRHFQDCQHSLIYRFIKQR